MNNYSVKKIFIQKSVDKLLARCYYIEVVKTTTKQLRPLKTEQSKTNQMCRVS
ncbi:hypothetical protein CDIMF43_280001 [Carnobacterium divergens]|nr:hypothetical protein CDIMF43_280001 [Carnobacterium divergens]